MSAAPLRVLLKISRDGLFAFTFRPRMRDGSAFDWPSFRFDYALRDEDGRGFALSEGAGIERRLDLGVLVLRRPDPHGLTPGRYRHALQATHAVAGPIPLFEGAVTVTEGLFP